MHVGWQWILMTLTNMIDNDETLKLTEDQVHKVLGQGHLKKLCIYAKILSLIWKMNGWLDLDDIYKHDWYWWDYQVDSMLRSQGQR